MMEYVSVDYYQPPLTEEERSTWNFQNMRNLCRVSMRRREEILEERRVAEMVCYKCRRTLRKRSAGFPQTRNFTSVWRSARSTVIWKGKIRMKKSEDGSFFAVKTTKLVGEEEQSTWSRRRRKRRRSARTQQGEEVWKGGRNSRVE